MICILELAIERRRVRCNGRVHGVERHLVRRKRKLSIVASARYVIYRCTGTAGSHSFMLMCWVAQLITLPSLVISHPTNRCHFLAFALARLEQAIARTRREQFLQPPGSADPSPAGPGPDKPIAVTRDGALGQQPTKGVVAASYVGNCRRRCAHSGRVFVVASARAPACCLQPASRECEWSAARRFCIAT